MSRFKEYLGKIRNKYLILTSKKYTTIAGTLVFFFVMSIVPFSFWLSLIVGRWFDYEIEKIFEFELFEASRDIIIFLRDNARNATRGASLLLIVTSLYSSTNLFYHMRRSGELIYGYEETKGGLKVRLSALLLTLMMTLLLGFFIVFVLSGYYLLSVSGYYATGEIFIYLFIVILSFLIAFILNLYICPYKIRASEVLPGSALTTVLWSLAAGGFSIYLRFADYTKLYGAISAIIIFLLWLYLMMSCFVIGVIINSDRNKYVLKDPKRL